MGASPRKAPTGEAKPKPPRKPRKAKPAAGSRGLATAEMTAELPKDVSTLADAVRTDGGVVCGTYRDPLGGHWCLIVGLPVDVVAPTDFQRDVSEAHSKRLADVIGRLDRFLDPIIVIRAGAKQYHTPNGSHRLAALKALGARSITALLVPEPEVAFKILALNVEKAHNLREKALEVIRMYRALVAREDAKKRPETDFALEFEEPAFATLGACYEKNGRFAGGAYAGVLRRCEAFLDQPLGKALAERAERAAALLALDTKVAALCEGLRARGLVSPYLRAFVVARLNPIRFARGATLPVATLLEKMTAAADKFDAGKIRPQDIAASGGAPDEPA